MDLTGPGAWERHEAYVRELEIWLAMLVALFGEDGDGTKQYRLEVSGEAAEFLRARLRPEPIVIIGADPTGDFTVDVL